VIYLFFEDPGEKEVADAIESALEARRSWSKTFSEDRALVFLKAAFMH